MYLFKLQNVFVQNAKFFGVIFKMYLQEVIPVSSVNS